MCSMRVQDGANSPSIKEWEPVDLTTLRAKDVTLAVMLPDESFAVFHLALGSSNKNDNAMFDREIKMQIDRDEKSKSFESCRLRKAKLLKHLELGNSKSDRPSPDAVHCEECSQSAPSTRSKRIEHRRMYKA
ncbi:hypothetical protein NDA14_005891 [Ustilago hordei]|nr:hypothetical protein NDA14_005891 [Ustilago hordei]